MTDRRKEVERALSSVIDPELGIDIVSLGLVYHVSIDGDDVCVVMTLTTPGCPMHGTISADVEQRLRQMSWIENINVRVTYDPPWTPERLTARARVLLGR